MLIIDEADALLSDRRGAARGWGHLGQRDADLDGEPPASVGLHHESGGPARPSQPPPVHAKLRFDPLDPVQAARSFKHFFDVQSPGALPEGLTPGYFAAVCRKRDLFGAANLVL
jgi:hypothetical protein